MRYIISLALTSLLASPAAAEVPKVVTDIHAVQSLVADVMGDLGSPTVLLDRGADEHSFQLRPSQAASLASADLVVWIGPELTPWLDRPLDSLSGDIARLGLLALPGTHLQGYGAEGEHDHAAEEQGHDDDHDHAAEDDHDHDHAHDHADGDGHDHSGTDPHAWLDPANARHWLPAIAAELARIDPANAATYAANAEAASARIAALDAEIAARLEPVHDRPFFVFHDAFGYFAGHYGLTVAGSIAAGDAADPGAAHLAELREKARAGAAVCIFPEPQHDAALAQRIAEDTGLRLGGALDPSGSTLEPGPALYPALLTGLADTILACLQG